MNVRLRTQLVVILLVALATVIASSATAVAQSPDEEPVPASAGVTSDGIAPHIECKWELPDVDSALARIQYGEDDDILDEPGFPCDRIDALGEKPEQADGAKNVIQVIPNAEDQPEAHRIENWAAVDHPNGVDEIDDVFWKVFHPDGTFKIQIHGTKVQVADSGDGPTNADLTVDLDDLGGTSDVGTMFYAAHATGQVSSDAVHATDWGMLDLIRQRQKDLWYADWQIHKEQPCGKYTVEVTAVANGEIATLTNTLDILCFYTLEIDFDTVDWGTITPGGSKVLPGDTNFGSSAFPTVKNTGNSGMQVGVHFSKLLQVGVPGPKEITVFDAAFGKNASVLEWIDPVNAGEDAWFSGSNHNQVLCANQVGKLDLSIHPPSVIPAGNYQGTVTVLASSAPGICAGEEFVCEDRVNDTFAALAECVTLEGVRSYQAELQSIADANSGNRTTGSSGYDASVDYVVEQLSAAGYNVTVQSFTHRTFQSIGPSTLERLAPSPTAYVEGFDFKPMSESEPGDVTAAVIPVDLKLAAADRPNSTSGCEAGDFAGFVPGSIALVQRGACTFQVKSENAEAAGAIGVIIFNQGNSPSRLGLISGTLSSSYSGSLPVMGTSFGVGEDLASTPGATLHMHSNVVRGDVTASNVIAESTTGDPNKVVIAGAHLDSVVGSPGIQDNGSGSAALIEVAKQMANVQLKRQVRFAWWGAHESGLAGSTHYVNSLTPTQLGRITQYLDFEMIGSPNHVSFVRDGDDSEGVGFGPGPVGSGEIEAAFVEYYDSVGEPIRPADFDGRSDYLPFIQAGVPSGGIFSGAEVIKTADEAAIWGGTAGDQYDPCYHVACDTFDNINLAVLDRNSDAAAYAILKFAMTQ